MVTEPHAYGNHAKQGLPVYIEFKYTIANKRWEGFK